MRNSVRDQKDVFVDRETGRLNKASSGQNSLGSVGRTSANQDTSVFDLRALKQRYKQAENVQRAKQEARLLTEGCVVDTPNPAITQRLPQSHSELPSSPTKAPTLITSSITNIKKQQVSLHQPATKAATKTSKTGGVQHATSHSPSVSRINAALGLYAADNGRSAQGQTSPHKTSVHLQTAPQNSANVSRLGTAQKSPPTVPSTSGHSTANKKHSVSKLHSAHAGMGLGGMTSLQSIIVEQSEHSTLILQKSALLDDVQLGSSQSIHSSQKKKSFAGGLGAAWSVKPESLVSPGQVLWVSSCSD